MAQRHYLFKENFQPSNVFLGDIIRLVGRDSIQIRCKGNDYGYSSVVDRAMLILESGEPKLVVEVK